MTSFDAQDSEEEKPSEEESSSGNGFFLLAAMILVVFLVVNHIAGAGIALSTTLCFATILVAVLMCWDLRGRVWFWGVIALVAALHVPLILMIHWPRQWVPGIVLMPIGVVDCVIIVRIVRFVQKSIVKDVPPEGEE
jgi:hypothetical protein